LFSLSKDLLSYKASDLFSYIFADKNIFGVKNIVSLFSEKNNDTKTEQLINDLELVFENLSKVMEEEANAFKKKAELAVFLPKPSKQKDKLGTVEKLAQGETEKLNVQLVAIKERKNKLLKEKEDIEQQLQVNVTQIMTLMAKERKMKEKEQKQKTEKKVQEQLEIVKKLNETKNLEKKRKEEQGE